jgi:putative DNA methylase
LEAQRLGLAAYGSDLNPVAVLITKALIEIPPRFAGRPPVHPDTQSMQLATTWQGAQGLAEDVRYYGNWMRDEAEKRIGHLYPKVRLPKEQGGGEATVIAWLWARTVTCPNPACGAQMPLVRSFALSTKKGKQAWVEPIVDPAAKTVRFEVRTGQGRPSPPPKVGRGAKFRCLVCNEIAEDKHIKNEGVAGRMGSRLLAIVAEGRRGRVYLPPSDEQAKVALSAEPTWAPQQELANDPRNLWTIPYGMTTFADLFTPRQLVALTTFSDLVAEARELVLRDAVAAGLPDDSVRLADGGSGAQAYADAVGVYLGLGVDRCVDFNNSLTRWVPSNEKVMNLFARQAIPMVWDHAEADIMESVVGGLVPAMDYVASCICTLPAATFSEARQADASAGTSPLVTRLISTDPPYYDNIGYADLSDFFYVWLRRSLRDVFPDLFSTLLVPKSQELVATPYRFDGNKKKAERFFEQGLGRAFEHMKKAHSPEYPLSVYYAFKQAESEESDGDGKGPGHALASTGWETMLEGLLGAGFLIDGTWPMRSEQSERILASGTNALASSIVLVCRPRPDDAPLATRKEFVARLKRDLPDALKKLQHGNIAPVDLAQAAIGPGMSVFSSYAKVLEPDGSAMTVRTALGLINQALDEVLHEQESEYDQDTRWAVAWFEEFGTAPGEYGRAETLSKAKDTSIDGLARAGILEAKAGKVRLLSRDELPEDWDPTQDKRLTVWEATQYLIRALDTQGEEGAAALLRQVGPSYGEIARDLAYRLYVICERKKWAQEALAYNSLVVAWPEVTRLASRAPGEAGQQSML